MANGAKPLKQKDIKPLREKLWRENDYCCPICKQELELSDLALDHDHQTTFVRNTICKKCNSLEGSLRAKWKRSGLMKIIDFNDFLLSLAEYLSNDQLPYIHPMHTAKPRKLMKSSYNELKREIDNVNKYMKKPIKIPDYPKSKRLTKKLKELYDRFGIYPRYYSK